MKQIFSPKKPFLWILLVLVVTAAVLCVLFIPRPVEVPSALDGCVRSVLYEVHRSSHTEGKYPALTYTALATVEKGDAVTLYGVMMYREYTCTTQDRLQVWGAAHGPFAITATRNADGSYTATDCWWPEDGADHISSIKKKFPTYCEGKAANYSDFYVEHSAACDAAASRDIADDEKYVVMHSERENIRLAYCAKTSTAFINFGAGYITDGAYAVEDARRIFTFGEGKLVFTVDDERLVYDAASSEKIPAVWQSAGNSEYLTDGIRFVLEGSMAENIAPVGPTFVVSSSGWMDETALRELFGQYIPSTFPFDTADIQYFPVQPIKTRAQLERLIEAYTDRFTDLTLENFARYDEAFFEKNHLIMTYYKDGLASCEPKVDSYVYVEDGTSLWLSVRLKVKRPTAGDTVEGEWLLFSGIDIDDYEKATGLEAYVERTVTKDDVIYSGDTLSLTGRVKQVEGRAVLMESYDVEQFAHGVWVELGDAELDPMVGEE